MISKLPWHVTQEGEIADANNVFVASLQGECEDPNWEDNAEFILSLCNSHETRCKNRLKSRIGRSNKRIVRIGLDVTLTLR
jgi:hypothetical protein